MERFNNSKIKRNLFVTVVIFLTFVIITLIYGFFLSNDENLNENTEAEKLDGISNLDNIVKEGPLDINQGNYEEGEENNNSQSDDEFIFKMNKKIVFETPKSLGNVQIENPIFNQYNFYVEVKLKDNDKIIYKSPILEPNHHIDNDYLILNLNKGTYNAIATIFIIKPESDEVIAQNNAEIQIKIKKN